MLKEKIQLAGFEVRKDIGAACNVKILTSRDTLLEEDLLKIATGAYIVNSAGPGIPRGGMMPNVLAGKTTWALDGFRLVPSNVSGELQLLFRQPGSNNEFIVQIWRAGIDPGFRLRINLPVALASMQDKSVFAEGFTFQTEEHDGRKTVTAYRDGDTRARYYPHYRKGDTFDECYVVKEVTKPLKNTRRYELN